MKKCLLDLHKTDFEDLVSSLNQPKYRANQIYSAVFSGLQIDEITNISKELREKLKEEYVANPVSIYKKFESKDGTIKYALKLQDDEIIECVVLSYKYGRTICLSTQVGCRMGCAFCASGLNGLVRNLSSGEILGEILAVNRDLNGGATKREITNIVLMGSGEPLDNYENVTDFLRKISSPDTLGISQRNISLSTCGLVPKIKQLADDGFSITLTISLHAPNDETRKQIMKIANAYDLKSLIEATKYYFKKTGRRVVFEYAMISGVNDSFEHAKQLAKLVSGYPTHINLIPLNSVKEKNLLATSKKQIYAFKDKLEELGASVSIRRSLGADVEGACGQLRNKLLKNS